MRTLWHFVTKLFVHTNSAVKQQEYAVTKSEQDMRLWLDTKRRKQAGRAVCLTLEHSPHPAAGPLSLLPASTC
jgi:hypothetical protein